MSDGKGHQHDEERNGQREDRVDQLLLGDQVHEVARHQRSLDDRDEQRHGHGNRHGKVEAGDRHGDDRQDHERDEDGDVDPDVFVDVDCVVARHGCRCVVARHGCRLQKIQRREEEDPDQIHEMPEEARVLDPVGEPHRIRLPELRAGAPEIGVHHHPAEHVEHVQAGQRVVDGEEVVGAGKFPQVEMVAVFEVLDHEEDEPEQDRRPHVDPKGPEAAAHQRRPGHDHRDGGRNQDDRVERGERDVQNRVSPRPARRPRPDQDVAREQGSEQHDLRGEEEPDADLAVGQTGVAPNLDGVGDVHRESGLVLRHEVLGRAGNAVLVGPPVRLRRARGNCRAEEAREPTTQSSWPATGSPRPSPPSRCSRRN